MVGKPKEPSTPDNSQAPKPTGSSDEAMPTYKHASPASGEGNATEAVPARFGDPNNPTSALNIDHPDQHQACQRSKLSLLHVTGHGQSHSQPQHLEATSSRHGLAAEEPNEAGPFSAAHLQSLTRSTESRATEPCIECFKMYARGGKQPSCTGPARLAFSGMTPTSESIDILADK